VAWTVSLLSVSAAAFASAPASAPPQEPAGFVAGAVIGGFAAGPIGAVVGAGLGTWLGNRVHRAGEAAKAQAEAAALQTEKLQLQADKLQLQTDQQRLQTEQAALVTQTSDLSETNRELTARLDQLSRSVDAAQGTTDDAARDEAATVLDGLQGDVLFRTGSADISAETTQELKVLAEAVVKSPGLTVRVDGYADPRGTVETNLKLSEARAAAVRDLFLAAGVSDKALEVNAYGKSRSVANDSDGYAFERRVRLTLQAVSAGEVAQSGTSAPDAAPAAHAGTAAPQTSESE
jgi:outer membrane protein OmpA-like peptidoglycan-associated protein